MSSPRLPIRMLVALVAIFTLNSLRGQEITPVDVDTKKPEQPRLHYYDKHGNKLDEPVYFLTDTDTVKKTSAASPWPLFNGVTIGCNFFDAAMLIAGQSYASFDLHASVSILNWIFPTVEAGLGYASSREKEGTMLYRTHLSPYIKFGLDYNFLYKGTPDYMAGLGIRCGWSHPKYEITGVKLSSGYWGETSDINIYNQTVNAWYGEALATVKVKIWQRLSLGWSIRYRFKMKIPDASQSTPWYIPGYGGNSPITATFSIMYTFGGKNKLPEDSEKTTE